MAKRFSLVELGDLVVVKSGFIEPDTLPEIDEYIKLIAKTPTYEEIKVTIIHELFLDFEGAETTDTTEEEVKVLEEKLIEFYDYGCIEEQEVIEIEGLYGVLEDEIVELIEV